MALAPFFDRVYGALGGHLAISRESLTAALEKISVGIEIDELNRKNDIWISELTTNLIARLYPRISITGNSQQVANLKQIATKINPNIEFVEKSDGFTTICIGSTSANNALYPSAAGWVARLNHQPGPISGTENPFSSGAAAAFACAELFRRIFLKSSAESDVSVSLLNFDNNTGSTLELGALNIGEVLFAGLGAVGNGGLWALSRCNVQGKIWLVDAESVELSNLQRYVLTSATDVGRVKTHVAKAVISHTKLEIKEKKTTLEKFADIQHTLKIPTIVISIDNVAGRQAAQALLPKLVINGWTGEQALGASWHVFSRHVACLACLYHPHGQGVSATEQAAKALGLPHDRAALLWITHQPLTESDIQQAAATLGIEPAKLAPWRNKSLGDLYTDVVCGAVPLDVGGVGKIETVPLAHQSALAGILMAAELVKRTDSKLMELSQIEPLISWDNVLKITPAIWKKPRGREKGCICGDSDYQKIYENKWT